MGDFVKRKLSQYNNNEFSFHQVARARRKINNSNNEAKDDDVTGNGDTSTNKSINSDHEVETTPKSLNAVEDPVEAKR